MSGEYQAFVDTHATQLAQWKFPPALWPPLYEKLSSGLFDAGSSMGFTFEVDREPRYRVVATQDIAAGGDVWLLDHAVSFTQMSELFQNLRANPDLLDRVAAIVEEVLPDVSDDEADDDEGSDQEAAQEAGTAAFGDAVAAPTAHAAAEPCTAPPATEPSAPPSAASAQLAAPDVGDDQPSLYDRVCRKLLRYVFEFGLKMSPDAPVQKHKYMLDELGSRLRPAGPTQGEPNVAVVPFVLMDGGGEVGMQPLSIMWPLKEIKEGDELLRSPLPPGLADFSDPTFWHHAFLGAGVDARGEWYALPNDTVGGASDESTRGGAGETAGGTACGTAAGTAGGTMSVGDDGAASGMDAGVLTAGGDLAAAEPWARIVSAALLRHAVSPAAAAAESMPGAGAAAAAGKAQQQQQQQQALVSLPLLLPGCGMSMLGPALSRLGYERVVNVDLVPPLIDAMRASCGPRSGYSSSLEWVVGDVTNLRRQFPADGVFKGIVDKAMLDALWTAAVGGGDGDGSSSSGVRPEQDERACWRTSPEDLKQVHAYLREMGRLLADDGVFLVVSLRSPGVIDELLASASAMPVPAGPSTLETPAPTAIGSPAALDASSSASIASTAAAASDRTPAASSVPPAASAGPPSGPATSASTPASTQGGASAAEASTSATSVPPLSPDSLSWHWVMVEHVGVPGVGSRGDLTAHLYICKKRCHPTV